MKWNYAQNNFPLLILYFALMSADTPWRHPNAAQWTAGNVITRLLSVGHTMYALPVAVGDTAQCFIFPGKCKTKGF